MNALAKALQALAAASTALEHTAKPSLKDVEDAKDQAKSAHEILDAAHKLLKRGIYAVADAPTQGEPLFDGDGGPARGTAETKYEFATDAAGELTCNGQPVMDAEVIEREET